MCYTKMLIPRRKYSQVTEIHPCIVDKWILYLFVQLLLYLSLCSFSLLQEIPHWIFVYFPLANKHKCNFVFFVFIAINGLRLLYQMNTEGDNMLFNVN